MEDLMIRTAGWVAAVAAAGAFAVLAAGPAQAATGEVSINGKVYQNPTGCIDTGNSFQTIVGNTTDKVVEVHAGRNCAGPVVGRVDPAGLTMVPNGSLLILE
ncbi:hypothetical protein AWN90_29995 [Nocardia terpenica]|uniref:Secreted protein n=2 Tax=Nocardia terpenica TaxID=455432 RepID=A0A164M2S5_9NOCA|nr:hypothetical protein AWN90_29995 [Nocardia terpenica]